MIKANSIEDILPGGDHTSYQACDSELCVCRSLHVSTLYYQHQKLDEQHLMLLLM